MKRIIFTSLSLLIVGSICAYTLNERMAKVEQTQGMFLYIKSKPTEGYDYKGTVQLGAVKSFRVSDVVPKMIRKVKELHPEADAIIFTEEDLWKADAVKLK